VNGYFADAGTFLISVFFGFFILMVTLRFLLQWARADFYNPISQFVVKITNPAVVPLRRYIPSLGGLDMASIVLMLLLQFIELTLITLIHGKGFQIVLLLVFSFTHLLSLVLWIFIIAIIVMAVASWIAPTSYNPVLSLLHQLTAPIMRPVQNRMPPMSGLDLSPLVLLVILNLIVMAIPYLERALLNLLL
jgi:YggT family protein